MEIPPLVFMKYECITSENKEAELERTEKILAKFLDLFTSPFFMTASRKEGLVFFIPL